MARSERDWEIVKGAWQVVLESNPDAAHAVDAMLDEIRALRAENERLRAALMGLLEIGDDFDDDFDQWPEVAVARALINDKKY